MYCKWCSTDKTMDAFYKSNHAKCKECICSTVKAYRKNNFEAIRAYDRMRGSMPHRVAARQKYQKTEGGKAAVARSHHASILRHPERRAANIALGNAIRDGRLHKQPCWVCGLKAVAHHPDYSRPLEVVWLCQPHHKQTHALVSF